MTPDAPSTKGHTLLAHCGDLLTLIRSATTWEGQPGQGHQVETRHYRCQACTADITVTIREAC